MSKWISVKDELPKIGEIVMGADCNGTVDIDYLTTANKFTCEYPEETDWPITHWMPLPEPPKE